VEEAWPGLRGAAAGEEPNSDLLRKPVAVDSGDGGGGLRSLETPAPYSDEKVANRDTKVWHFVIKNGY
jgi:hypothetical protein